MNKSDIIGVLAYTIFLLLFTIFEDVIPDWGILFIMWIALLIGYFTGKSKN